VGGAQQASSQQRAGWPKLTGQAQDVGGAIQRTWREVRAFIVTLFTFGEVFNKQVDKKLFKW